MVICEVFIIINKSNIHYHYHYFKLAFVIINLSYDEDQIQVICQCALKFNKHLTYASFSRNILSILHSYSLFGV